MGLCWVSELILCHTDNLSRTLQKSEISAAEGRNIAGLVVKTLQSLIIRSDNSFKLFWEKTNKEANDLGVMEPCLPRQRKTPRRLDDDASSSYSFPATSEDCYRQIYFEAIDLIVNCINDRFDQPGIYQNLQNLLLQAVNSKEYEFSLFFITDFYASDFDSHQLKTKLHVLSTTFSNAENGSTNLKLPDIIEYFKSRSPAELALFSEIGTLLKLLLVMPATNAVSKWSFSALHRIKSYLRSIMTQDRLNDLMILYIHQDLTDDLDIKSCTN